MKKYFIIFALVLAVSLGLFLTFAPAILDEERNVVVEHQAYEISDQAQQLHSSLLIGDWHADSLLWMRNLSE
ncbi:peptidase M19, partial [Porticoccaceae bacterium]|nr:peptidase M19 [Porticoccaceae bacterium]